VLLPATSAPVTSGIVVSKNSRSKSASSPVTSEFTVRVPSVWFSIADSNVSVAVVPSTDTSAKSVTFSAESSNV